MPKKQICCLCGKATASPIFEDRPSGMRGEPEQWAYCPDCWNACHSNGYDPELVAGKYLVLIRWMLLPYYERHFRGRYASRIEPRKRAPATTGEENNT